MKAIRSGLMICSCLCLLAAAPASPMPTNIYPPWLYNIWYPTQNWAVVEDWNPRGEVVGWYLDQGKPWLDNAHFGGFYYYKGQYTQIRYPGARYTLCYEVRDRGVVYGEFGTANSYGWFKWSKGKFTVLKVIE